MSITFSKPFIFILILTVANICVAQTQPEPLLKRGTVYLESYEFEKALAAADQALQKLKSGKRKSPALLASVYFFYGEIYEKGFYLEKAIEAYTTALKFNPKKSAFYERRGRIYQYIGETEKADADFDKADSLIKTGKNSTSPGTDVIRISADSDPAIPAENFQVIRFKELSGFIKEITIIDADKDGKISDEEIRKPYLFQLLKLHNLVRFNPKSDLALWKRGDLFLQINELSQQLFWVSAVSDFTNAFELNPRFEYLNNRGVVRAKRDNKANYEFAVKDFSEAIGINPHSIEAFYNRGLSYLKLAENENAVADFTEVIKLNPKFLLAYKSRARAFRLLGKTVEAEADEKMLRTPNISGIPRPQPVSDEELFNSSVFSSLGQFKPIPDGNEELKELARKEVIRLTGLLDEAPALYARAFVMRGHNYLKLGEFERAVADYTEAIKYNELDALNFRGVVHARRGNYDAAIADFTKALTPEVAEVAKFLDLELKSNTLFYNRALAQFNQGEFVLAVADLTAILKSNPNNEKAYQLRAKAYRKISKIVEAEADEAKVKSLEKQ
jgi:tetratricopeptide (TPR) repeat protein